MTYMSVPVVGVAVKAMNAHTYSTVCTYEAASQPVGMAVVKVD